MKGAESQKANLTLLSGEELTFENIVSMYEAMMGRKVTQAELAEMKEGRVGSRRLMAFQV